MNWLRQLLGLGGKQHRETDFSVHLKPLFRENVSVIYTRGGTSLAFAGQRIGRKWKGIEVHIPAQFESERVPQIVADLETAFRALGEGYVIARGSQSEIVPEAERQAAIAELSEMGYEVEVLTDGKIRQTRRANAPRHDIETLRRTTPRMMSLLQAVHGTRSRLEILAESKEFEGRES